MNIIDKPVNTTEVMPEVPVSRLRVLTEKTKDLQPSQKITLQLVLTALFPTVWKNIEKYCNDCYMNGYLHGLKDGKNENQGIS